jgi:hypothetical protein
MGIGFIILGMVVVHVVTFGDTIFLILYKHQSRYIQMIPDEMLH